MIKPKPTLAVAQTIRPEPAVLIIRGDKMPKGIVYVTSSGLVRYKYDTSTYPTVVDGVQKVVTKLISGIAPRKALTPEEEIIVAQNSTYVMKIIPSVSNTDIALELIWMEVK